MTAAVVLRADADGGICTLSLNRPDKLNALNTEAFSELEAHVSSLENRRDDVRCVVLQGEGRAFCAGADLETASTAAAETAAWKSQVLQRLEALPVPVVAKVHGHCLAGGMELALCADLIVAASDARFADAHGRWGLVPAWGLTQRLPRRVGVPVAKYLCFTGRTITGVEAHRLGLVDLVAGEGMLDATVAELVNDIVANSAFTNREIKLLMQRTDGLSISDGLAHEHYRLPRRDPQQHS